MAAAIPATADIAAPPMRWRGWLAAAIAAVIFVIAAFPLVPPEVRTVAPDQIKPSGGNAYYVELNDKLGFELFTVITDSNTGPRASTLQVMENGMPLSRPHSIHSDIITTGEGRYSHWGIPGENVVLFSTSDNTDPRTNGRSYTLRMQPTLSPMWSGALLLIGLVALVIAFEAVPARIVALGGVALGVLVTAAWCWVYFGQVEIQPDSVTYVNALPLVPLGYPLFLMAVQAVFGSLVWTALLQLLLTGLVCLFCGYAVARATGRPVAGLLVVVGLAAYAPMFFAAAAMLSEALYGILILANFVSLALLLTGFRIRYALLLGVSAALVTFIRPAGYFIALAVIFAVFAVPRHERRRMLVWALLPFVLTFALTLGINAAMRGSTTASQTGRVLFPHVAFLFDPAVADAQDKDIAAAIDQALEPHREAYAKVGDNPLNRFNYLAATYNDRLSSTDPAVEPFLIAEYEKLPPPRGPLNTYTFNRLNQIYVSLFLRTILHDPLGYVDLVVNRVYGTWAIRIITPTPVPSATYAEYSSLWGDRKELIATRRLPLSDEQVRLDPARFAPVATTLDLLDGLYSAIRANRWWIYLIGIVTAVAIPVALFRRRASPHWTLLAYCGILIHGSVLLTAAVTVSIARYALAVDPIVLIAGVVIVDWLARLALRILPGGKPRRAITVGAAA